MTHLNLTPAASDAAAANNHANSAAKQVARWRVADIVALYELPFNDLMFRAQQTHREHFDANTVQLSTLLSIKTGGCEEDCAYCPQSVHHDTGLQADKLMPVDEVLAAVWARHGAIRRTATSSRSRT
jgi:biotin synthase